MIELRPYQSDAVTRLREALLRGRRRVVASAPTGSGKTCLAANIVLNACQRGRRTIFVAHRRELVNQTHRKLVDAGIPANDVGVLMADDKRARPDAPVQIVSIATYLHRQPPPADLVIIDECHRALSPTYRKLIKHYAGTGARVLGLSATPFRANGDGLGDIFEELVQVSTPRELIAAGFLVEPRVFSGGEPDLSGVHVRGGDFVEGELQDAMNQTGLVGGIVEHWQRLAEGRRTVCFASGVEHSRAITAAFVDAGIAAEHLDGTTPTTDRDAILARLDKGETLIVSNCGVLCEGWDMPSCKGLILAKPTKSLGLYMQQAGRVLRPWNNVRPIILDHGGNALRHGLPHDDRTYSLEGGRSRSSSAASTRKCPVCKAIIRINALRCPECNSDLARHEPAPQIAARGRLIEIVTVPDACTRNQIAACENVGYHFDWRLINQRQAQGLLETAARRRAEGLCSVKMAEQLRKRGLNPDCSYADAKEAIAKIVACGWRTPASLRSDPRFALPEHMRPQSDIEVARSSDATQRQYREAMQQIRELLARGRKEQTL